MYQRVLQVVITLLFLPWSGHCHSYEDTNTLMDSLLANYDKTIRPLNDQNDPVDMRVQFGLVNINQLDQVREIITVTVYSWFSWRDEKLVWNPSDHNNITDLNPTTSQIWHPDIYLTNSGTGIPAVTDTSSYVQPLRLHNDGNVSMFPEISMTTTCKLIMTKFPYDSHTCFFRIYQPTFTRAQFTIRPLTEVFLGSYSPNGEWELTGCSMETGTYVLGGMESEYLSLNIKVQRRPLFFVLNLLFPTCALSFLNVLVFILPADSGEKVSYSITVLLSVMLFMSTSATILPPTSEVVPLITQYLTSLTIISILSVVATVIILIVHHRKEEEERETNTILSVLDRWKNKLGSRISKLKNFQSKTIQVAPAEDDKLNKIIRLSHISNGRILASRVSDIKERRNDIKDDQIILSKGNEEVNYNTKTPEENSWNEEQQNKSALITMSQKENKNDDPEQDSLRRRILNINRNESCQNEQSKFNTELKSSTSSVKLNHTNLDTIFFIIFLTVWCSVTIGYMAALYI